MHGVAPDVDLGGIAGIEGVESGKSTIELTGFELSLSVGKQAGGCVFVFIAAGCGEGGGEGGSHEQSKGCVEHLLLLLLFLFS